MSEINTYQKVKNEVSVFSNREERFIKQDELKAYENGKIKDKAREAEIKALVDKGEHINLSSTKKKDKRVVIL